MILKNEIYLYKGFGECQKALETNDFEQFITLANNDLRLIFMSPSLASCLKITRKTEGNVSYFHLLCQKNSQTEEETKKILDIILGLSSILLHQFPKLESKHFLVNIPEHLRNLISPRPNTNDSECWNPIILNKSLCDAARKGDAEIGRKMLQFGADIETIMTDKVEYSQLEYRPLHWAVDRSQSLNFVKMLIENDVEINSQDLNGRSALHLSLNQDIMRILLEQKPNLEIQQNSKIKALEGETPLHTHTRLSNKNLVTMLLKYGANIEAKDERGKTPLMIAVLKEDIDMVELLLDYGANAYAKDKSGKFAIKYSENQKFRCDVYERVGKKAAETVKEVRKLKKLMNEQNQLLQTVLRLLESNSKNK